MKIIIEYESSWRNSFLDGSNNEALPKNERKYIAAKKFLTKEEDSIKKNITKDTIMGILNRLIGDQRKLYQSRKSENYYFRDIEEIFQEYDIIDKSILSNEIVYLRNISGSTDPNSFAGMFKNNVPIVSVEYAEEFWKILWLDLDDLIDFIHDDKYVNNEVKPILDPSSILGRLEYVKKNKVNLNERLEKSCNILQAKYPNFEFKKSGDKFSVLPIYCSSLYLQLDRLSKDFDTSMIRAPRGGLTGISHNGFTPKNFLSPFTTGGEKMIWGNPYMFENKKKGENKINPLLTKANGVLEINLNISEERAKDLEQKILDAGVSSFYLGKKGLAYVTKIDTRESS